MTTFDIRFIQAPNDEDPKLAWGEIQIGAFSERFRSDVSYWGTERYERQWLDAVSNLLRGHDRTALLTSLVNPETANFVRFWTLHRVGDAIAVQEQICFMDSLHEPFDPESVERFVPPRETVTEDGHRISEWSTTIASLQAFVDRHEDIRS